MKNKILPIASGVVLLGATTILGFLGKPTEMGLALVAGAIGLAFSNLDKISEFKGAGFEAKMREQQVAESVVSKQTDDIEELKVLSFEINPGRQAIMSSLLHTEFNSRFASGIAADSGYSNDVVKGELEWMQKHDLVSKRAGKKGYLWNLTEKGMALLPIVVFGRNPL